MHSSFLNGLLKSTEEIRHANHLILYLVYNKCQMLHFIISPLKSLLKLKVEN